MFTPCEHQDNHRAMNSYHARATVAVRPNLAAITVSGCHLILVIC